MQNIAATGHLALRMRIVSKAQKPAIVLTMLTLNAQKGLFGAGNLQALLQAKKNA
jgi:hypothetical protein